MKPNKFQKKILEHVCILHLQIREKEIKRILKCIDEFFKDYDISLPSINRPRTIVPLETFKKFIIHK